MGQSIGTLIKFRVSDQLVGVLNRDRTWRTINAALEELVQSSHTRSVRNCGSSRFGMRERHLFVAFHLAATTTAQRRRNSCPRPYVAPLADHHSL